MRGPKPSALRSEAVSPNEQPKPAGSAKASNVLGDNLPPLKGGFFVTNLPLILLKRSSILVGMNKLSTERRANVIRALVEGGSLRSVARMTGTDKDTVMRLLVEVGEFCSIYQHHTLVNLPCKRIEADEIWSFVGSKQKNAKKAGQGDLWTYTAIDADTKLAVSWLVGPRLPISTRKFILELSGRLANRVQLTTDGLRDYLPAVENAFGWNGTDYSQLVKTYGSELEESSSGGRRYSPMVCTGAVKVPVMGKPNVDLISTSYVERSNLTMRMQMRRFTRLTNGFSKKAENHAHAVSLHFMFYNYCRSHTTLTKAAKGVKTTPAMAIGLTDHVWTVEEILELMNPNYLLQ
jgi:IS1 family transposase